MILSRNMNRTGKRNVAWTPEQSTLYATQTVDHRCNFLQLITPCSASDVKLLHDAGAKISYFGCNEPERLQELLSRLARRNLIAPVRRGLYLVPPRLPPGGKWNPSEFVALTTLIERDCYCSLLLEDLLAITSQPWVFKGGTCLSKVHASSATKR